MYPGCDPTVLQQEFLQLNRGQKDAVKRVLRAKDYALILGLPGTGMNLLFTPLQHPSANLLLTLLPHPCTILLFTPS